ncbi:uncharacterized protein LOC115216627 [Octopus sinensis]|uniref:Uncharacterized protein LOC115216627 n=1 Tax=Octopus sinensis TaxID=2607531 RepID=A0A6P7SUJ2_9MOLL|nr:uncharacterized protein LOC115216627 [Octopus sinensis]
MFCSTDRIPVASGRRWRQTSYLSLLQLLLFILLCRADVVSAEASLTIKLAVASAMAVLMFILLMIIIVIGITCNKWYDKYQTKLGRGKIPAISSFWKKRKSIRHSVESARSKDPLSTYNSVIIPSPNPRNNETDTWIKKWANDTRQYEEMTKEMELGDETVEVPLDEIKTLSDSSKDGVPNGSLSHSVKTTEESLPSSYASISKVKTDEAKTETENQQNDIDTVVL